MPSISLPTAALVAGGLTAGATVYSGIQASNASKRAAQVQADAATLASNRQLDQYNDTKENLAPFIAAGTESLGTAKNLLGLPGTNGAPDAVGIQAALEATPGYQFTRDQGLKSVQNGYAAQGLASSGAALKGAAQFATGLANTTYEQRLQDYLGLAGGGLGAAEAQGQQGISANYTANQFSTSGAAATAAGIVGSTNAMNAGISGAASGLGQGLTLASVAPFLTQNGESNPLNLPGSSGARLAADFGSVNGTALNPNSVQLPSGY